MDKTVKFKIQLETNGEKVLHQLSVSTEDFSQAVSSAIRQTKGLDSALSDIAQAGLVFDSVRQAVEAVQGAVGMLADSYNVFDRSMRSVNTMAGVGAQELGALTSEVKALAATVPLAREELATGLYQVISNGVPRDNWISFLETSSRSAVGGMADLGQTVTVTSTIIKNYGLAWDSAADIQDKIQTTAKNGVTSFEQLASALPRVTSQAATLGVSIDELLASFATLTGVSGNTAEVSTQLAAVFTALVKPSSEASEMAQQMGIQFNAAAIKAAGGMQQFLASLSADIQAYAASNGMLEQEIYATLFGSAEAIRALTPLTGELSDTFSRNVSAMASSTGTMDKAFDEMAGSGQAVAQMLANQLANLTDWAGAVASTLQPYLSFVAVSGQAVSGLVLMASATRKAMAALVALATAHRSNAAISALVAVHTRVVALAQRMMAASSLTAAAGTTALTVAVTALYAAATMGLSVVITSLVALFASMGDEAEEAAAKVDILHDSTEAFASASSSAKAELDLELAALQRLMKGQGNEEQTIARLNAKYGDALGKHRTAAEWYKILVANSRAYCDQLAYEAQAKTLASSIAAKELEKEAKAREWAYLRQQTMNGKGEVTYNYDKVKDGKKRYEELGREIGALTSDIATMQAQYDSALSRMASAQEKMQTTAQANAGELNWQTASYTRLGEIIEQQKKKIGSLAGVDNKAADAEAKLLKQMEERYKALGKTYGLAQDKDKNRQRNQYNGDRLIQNASSYRELANNIQYYQKRIEETDPAETAEIQRLTSLRLEAEKAQAGIKAVMDEMGRPVQLASLEDFDREIQYQQQLRQRVSADELAAIDSEIQRLKSLRTAFEESSHTDLRLEEIQTYEQLDAEIARYEKRLKTASANSREEIQKQIISLRNLRQQWDDTLSSLDMPDDISRLNTIADLDKAISYYSERQKKASAGEITSLQRTLNLLEAKRNALQRLTELPAMQQELDDLASFSGKPLKMELELLGLDGVREKIRSLQRMLRDTKNPLASEQRQEVEKMVQAWQGYEKQIRRNSVSLTQTWGDIKGISSGVQGITDALQGNGSAWEKTMAVVDGVIAVYEGVSGIVAIIQALTAATHLQTGAKVAEAAATGAASAAQGTETAMQTAALGEKIAVIAANKAATASFLELAAAQYFAAHAYIPFAGFGIASGFATAAAALTKTVGLTPFADGGVVYGPTAALVGEYAGASSNPEIIAPLDKLRGILADTRTGDVAGGQVRFRIDGRTLVGVLEKENRISSRS